MLLIAGSTRDLAATFGFELHDGMVERGPMDDGAPDIFTRADGTLKTMPSRAAVMSAKL